MGAAEENDWFGSAVTLSEFNGDGRKDVAVGVYGEVVTEAAVGAVRRGDAGA